MNLKFLYRSYLAIYCFDKITVRLIKSQIICYTYLMNITNNITKGHSSHGAIYGMGFVGAVIYFISNATSFWMGVLGVVKAIVWPALLVYQALTYFGL